jgi:hypothetical protein
MMLQVKKVEQGVKKFFAFPMERKLMVKAQNFSFGYVGGSPISWDSKWWMEGLNMKVRAWLSSHNSCG